MDTFPVDVLFRGMPASPMVDVSVRRWANRLHRTFARTLECLVVIELPHHEQRRQFQVVVRLAIPGGEIVAGSEPGADGAHDDVHVAVRDAFRAARRQLEGQTRRHHHRGAKAGDAAAPPAPPT
jgi:hypothetical protein